MNRLLYPLFGACLLAIGGLFASPPDNTPAIKTVARVVRQEPPGVSIRLCAMKHSHISMADGDANLAMRAASSAAARGLDIKNVGDHNIDKDGLVHRVSLEDLPKLQAFVSQKMKVQASPGDTFIVFTIGHGAPNGTVQTLGERAAVMKALASAAEENNQRTLWWQLSCYAAAGLPPISSLPEAQQKLFSVLASSPTNQESPANEQGKIMEKVFMALAEKNHSIDPDGDGVITNKELRDFLNRTVGRGRGDLLFSISPDEPIFGGMGVANALPILDRNGMQREYPKGYIPVPGRR